MEKGHYGQYSGNSRHSRVTNHNMDATKRDDEAHMEYLKEDVKYDNKHGHSDSSMTADEKHISKLAGDLKYDEKHHGSARHDGTDNNHNGDITESPSKFTQVVRRFKYDQTGGYAMARNLATTALALAPIPSLGKINAVKKAGAVIKHNANIGTFGQTIRTASMFGIDGFRALPKLKPLSKQQLKKMSDNMPKSTSQNVQEAFSYPREVFKHKFPTSKPISGGGGTYGKPNPSNFTGSGISRGGNFNEIIGPLGKGLNKSKPVNVTGPNPAYKTGAGGNSYPR